MKPEKFMTFLMNEKNASLERTGKLAADNRKDEANQCKIEANIYGICATLYQMAWQKAGMDEVKADALFRDKVRAVSDDWSVSLEAARSHNDVSKIRAGQTKLVTVELVMKKYDRLAKKKFWFF